MKSKSYEEFVEKFKSKKPTDECYTPPAVYNVVANFVASHYGIQPDTMCRPFIPGGDYENFDYTGKIVVDNPPFSILAEIRRFFNGKNIKYFLFAPITTIGATADDAGGTFIPGARITYHNKAKIQTFFITNLENHEILFRTYPELTQALRSAQNQRKIPKYQYPKNVTYVTEISQLADTDVIIYRDETKRVRVLDAQKPYKKGIHGGGWYLSDSATDRLEKAREESADKKKTISWELTDRELDIIKKLNKRRK